jgi:hypothetical protein
MSALVFMGFYYLKPHSCHGVQETTLFYVGEWSSTFQLRWAFTPLALKQVSIRGFLCCPLNLTSF